MRQLRQPSDRKVKLVFFLIAVGLFAGAQWWHTHK